MEKKKNSISRKEALKRIGQLAIGFPLSTTLMHNMSLSSGMGNVLGATKSNMSGNRSNRLIQADLQKVMGQRSGAYNFCVGSGHARLGLRADWQEQLKEVKKAVNFKYIRFHGILDDEMGVFRKVGNRKEPVYNWQYIDKLYDFLLSIDVRPFVELSFMPSALASGDKTVFWYRGNITQPDNFNKWGEFITALVQHFENRYGKEEVEKWFFEVWNEPNLNIFFDGTQSDYYKLYTVTAKAIKSVSSTYRVGGPATAGAAWIPETIQYCKKHDIPLDFISTHQYGVHGVAIDAKGTKVLRLIENVDIISETVKKVHESIRKSPMPDLKLYMTEWSSSYSNVDPIHDTYQNAPYVLNTIKKSGNNAAALSYWTFTDIFEEEGPPVTPFEGGFGLLNMQGIKKPTFFAYKFLNELGETELRSEDPNSYVCTNQQGEVQILFWDLRMPSVKKSSDKKVFREKIPASAVGTVKLHVKNIKSGMYLRQIYQTGFEINDPFTLYYDMGLPTQLTEEQVKQLKTASSGKPVSSKEIQINNEGYTEEIPMRENDVFLIKLIRI